MNTKFERIRKETVMGECEIISRHLHYGAGENTKTESV